MNYTKYELHFPQHIHHEEPAPMQVNCPSCRSPLTPSDMNHTRTLAQCRHCQTLVDLNDLPSPEDANEARHRSTISLPNGFVLEDSPQGLMIVHRWFTSRFILLALACIFWDGYLISLYSNALVRNTPWIFIVFPLVHVIVGIGLTYYTIAGFLNHTTISIENDMLKIRHRPLPWFGNLDLPTENLRQLYVLEKKHQTRSGVTYTYQLCATTKDGRKLTLLSGLPEANQARFLEQTLETRLNIEDRPVYGEVSGL